MFHREESRVARTITKASSRGRVQNERNTCNRDYLETLSTHCTGE